MVTRSSPAVLPLALVAGTVVLAVAACGGSTAQPPSPTSSEGPTSAAAPTSSGPSTSAPRSPTASSSATSGGAPAGAQCSVADLRIRYATDPGGGGAGSVQGTLTFTNTGSTSCTLAGFPGVSLVGGGHGTQVGAAATRTDETTRTRTLAVGTSVRAGLRRSQPGAYGDDCQQTEVDGFRVFPPGSTESAFVAFKTTGCKSLAAPLLQVGPVG